MTGIIIKQPITNQTNPIDCLSNEFMFNVCIKNILKLVTFKDVQCTLFDITIYLLHFLHTDYEWLNEIKIISLIVANTAA